MFVTAVCVSGVVAAAAQFADLSLLEGRWRVASFRDADGVAGATVTVRSGDVVYRLPHATVRLGQVTRLSPRTGLKQVDLRRESESFPGVLPDETWLAVYELKGDTLRLCVNRPGRPRPLGFPSSVADAAHGAEWYVLTRDKK